MPKKERKGRKKKPRKKNTAETCFCFDRKNKQQVEEEKREEWRQSSLAIRRKWPKSLSTRPERKRDGLMRKTEEETKNKSESNASDEQDR